MAVLRFEVVKALKIALALRHIEALLPAEDRSFQRRHEQLLWLAGQFEAAARAAQPELPPHERPKTSNRKLVQMCKSEGCRRALTRDQAKLGDLCPACRQKAAAPS